MCLIFVRPAAHVSNRCKSGIRPVVGRIQPKARVSIVRWNLKKAGYGEHTNPGQSSGLTNRNHIRLCMRVRLQDKLKPNNYTESCMVNVADRWRERNVWYPGRSRQRMELHQQMHKKSVVTTNDEKSAEVIVPLWLQT